MMSWLCTSAEGKVALASPELAALLIQASDILARLADQRMDLSLLPIPNRAPNTFAVVCRLNERWAQWSDVEHKRGMSRREPRAQ